jgi:hypothetical protein
MRARVASTPGGRLVMWITPQVPRLHRFRRALPGPRCRSPQHCENHEHDHAKHESTHRHTRAEPDHVGVGMFRQFLDRQADDEQHEAEHQHDGAHHR